MSSNHFSKIIPNQGRAKFFINILLKPDEVLKRVMIGAGFLSLEIVKRGFWVFFRNFSKRYDERKGVRIAVFHRMPLCAYNA